MKFHFKNRVSAWDFWLLSMHHTYQSTVGIVNIVFTAAMIALTYKFGGHVHDALELLMFLGCILFPILQPLAVMFRSRAQAMMIPQELELEFTDKGLHVEVGAQAQDIPWKKIVSATKEYNMVIVRSDAQHGYMITNRMMGRQKDEFFSFVQSKIQKK